MNWDVLMSLDKTQRIVCLKKYHEDYRSACKLFSNLYLLITMLEVLFFFNLQCNYDKASLAKSIPKFYTECLVAPCKWIQIPESRIHEIFAFKIRNPGLWNPESCWWLESGIQQKKKWNPALLGIWNSLSWNSESSTRNPESNMRNAECKTVMDSLTRGESY